MDDQRPASDHGAKEEPTMEYYCNDDPDDNDDPDSESYIDFGADDDDEADAILEELREGDVDLLKMKQENYKILNSKEIRRRMEHDVAEASAVLSLSKIEASILLRHYNWSVSKVNDEWFDDESRVREKVGLLKKKPVMGSDASRNKRKFFDCGICFESITSDRVRSAACGHGFCEICWSAYISTSINNDGTGCLTLRCPEPSCRAAVGQEMIDSLASDEDRKKYSDFLVRSYIEENRRTKWCPGPDCECAVEFSGDDGIFDVTCHCFTNFCWNCKEESHRPVDCETVKKWVLKNSSESENINYILAYCKPCPQCKRPIEKNEGCMHMTCRVCHHQFCWLCLGPWTSHRCNRYQENTDPEEKKKRLAKESLEKYTHYFERWDANRSSKVKALADHLRLKDEEFKRLSELQNFPETHFEFITAAWLQVVECRRALEWSYAYGYYLPENEPAKKHFFEYLQGEAESTLEKLHNCVERELKDFLGAGDISKVKFNEFRTKLVGLTTVTGNYFEKLVRALENGLSDVSSSDFKKENNEGEDVWHCDLCSFANPTSVKICKMCVSQDDLIF